MSENNKSPIFRSFGKSSKSVQPCEINKAKDSQKIRFYQFLRENNATCSMVAEGIDVKQKNLTRYKRDYQKAGLLWVTKKGLCRLTGFRVEYLTTNPELMAKIGKRAQDGKA